MTGTGSAHFVSTLQSFSLQVSSTNSRFFDMQLQISDGFQHLEAKIRSYVQSVLQRGSVELRIVHTSQNQNLHIQKELIQSIQDALQDSGMETQLQVRDLYALGTIQMQEVVRDEDERLCMELVSKAVEDCLAYQRQEGDAIYTIVCDLINAFAKLVKDLAEHSKEIDARIEEKLNKRIETLTQLPVDEKTLHSVLVGLLVKASVTEELDRLGLHVKHFFETIDSSDSRKGKKLEFICQELVRETNTVGSKLPLISENDSIVEMKCIIEDIREQIRNIV